MQQVSFHKIVFYVVAALGAGLFTPLLLRVAAIAGPENPWPAGVGIGLALVGLTVFYRWFFARQFKKPASEKVWLWVAIGAAAVTAFAFAANWAERLTWLAATGTFLVLWLAYGFLWKKKINTRPGPNPNS